MYPIGPSPVPAPVMPTGSRVVISAPRSQVIVPPGWTSFGGAVVAGAVTLVVPPLGVEVTPLLPVAGSAGLFFVVAVVLAVVTVTDAAAVVLVVLPVVSLVAPAVVVVASAVVVVLLPGVWFDLLLPPHAAATSA